MIDSPPAKLMPIMPTWPSRLRSRLSGQPQRGILDHVGRARRDSILREIGQFCGQHGVPHRREVARELHEPRLVDAGRVHARHQQHRPIRRSARDVQSRPQLAAAPRNGERALVERPRFNRRRRARDIPACRRPAPRTPPHEGSRSTPTRRAAVPRQRCRRPSSLCACGGIIHTSGIRYPGCGIRTRGHGLAIRGPRCGIRHG